MIDEMITLCKYQDDFHTLRDRHDATGELEYIHEKIQKRLENRREQWVELLSIYYSTEQINTFINFAEEYDAGFPFNICTKEGRNKIYMVNIQGG